MQLKFVVRQSMKKQFIVFLLCILLIIGGFGWLAYSQVYGVTKTIENTANLSQYEGTFAVQQVLVPRKDGVKSNSSAFVSRIFVNGNDGKATVELDENLGKKNEKSTNIWKSGSNFYSKIEDDESQQYIGTSLKGEYYKLDESQKTVGSNFFERFNPVNFVKHFRDANFETDKLNSYFNKKTYKFDLKDSDKFKKLFLNDGGQLPDYDKDKSDVFLEMEKGFVKTLRVFLVLPQKNSSDYIESSNMYTYTMVKRNDVRADLPSGYEGFKTLNDIVTEKTQQK